LCVSLIKWENTCIIKKCMCLVYDVSVDVNKKCMAKGYFVTVTKEIRQERNTVRRNELEYLKRNLRSCQAVLSKQYFPNSTSQT